MEKKEYDGYSCSDKIRLILGACTVLNPALHDMDFLFSAGPDVSVIIHDRNRCDRMISNINIANMPNEKFIVTMYNTIEPNKTECGIDIPSCIMVFVNPFSNMDGNESDDISIIYESKVWTRISYEVMGIPAYYKKLIRSVSGLVSAHPHAVSWLFMDFNCLIYHCIPNVNDALKDDFESALIAEVVRYTREVVKEVAPSKGVYIAIDGVVPMAKMRQQRLRRFKSVWEKEHAVYTQRALPEMALPSEKKFVKPSEKDDFSWDRNAITPGTVFMKNLAIALQATCDEKGWILSSSESPGEGEGKIVTQWRTGVYNGADIAVYGMDADLIVLSLLGQYQNQLGKIWLFREAPPIDGIIGFEWFSIDILKGWILQGRPESFILTYCFAMSILGNDFLPSSLGLKMRDGGHDELLRCLTRPLIDDSYHIMEENVRELFRVLSLSEHHRITRYVQGKQRMAHHAVETGFGENNWPLTQIETTLLNADWTTEYWRLVGGDPLDVCAEYIKGIKWIWAYYTGLPVCFNWFYPYSLPPLWSMLMQMGPDSLQLGTPCQVYMRAEDIRPVEQLSLVLPLASWSLIPDCPEKRFPMLAPQFFPSSFEFEAVGKRFFWECEALIPIPTIIELKGILRA